MMGQSSSFPSRTTLAEIPLAGTTIPKGVVVTLALAAGNRDPARFLDPDTFDPERRDNEHLGFGSGIHSCFGAPLARTEAQIAFPSYYGGWNSRAWSWTLLPTGRVPYFVAQSTSWSRSRRCGRVGSRWPGWHSGKSQRLPGDDLGDHWRSSGASQGVALRRRNPIMNADVAPRGLKGRIRTVTISREYGSGGGEIASRLARRLGWDLVDHAIVERTARKLGTTLADAEAHDESVGGVLARVLESMHNVEPAYMAMAGAPPGSFLLTQDYRRTAEQIVRAAAEHGLVVIVGRASSVLLADRWDVMHVRVVAPFSERIAYVMRREALDSHAAEARIRHKDHERASYLEREYHHRPDESHLYDLVVNTSRLDLESAVDVIMFTVDEIAVGLPTKTGESGPATGLARYPTSPGDFHPSTP